MIDEFIPSKPFSVGVELELQLIDSKSGELVNGFIPLTSSPLLLSINWSMVLYH